MARFLPSTLARWRATSASRSKSSGSVRLPSAIPMLAVTVRESCWLRSRMGSEGYRGFDPPPLSLRRPGNFRRRVQRTHRPRVGRLSHPHEAPLSVGQRSRQATRRPRHDPTCRLLLSSRRCRGNSGYGNAVTPRPRHHLVEPIENQSPIGQSRKGIVKGQVVELIGATVDQHHGAGSAGAQDEDQQGEQDTDRDTAQQYEREF